MNLSDVAEDLKIEDLVNTGQIVKRTEAVDDTDDFRLDKAVDLHVTSSEEEKLPEDKKSSNVSTAVLLLQAEVMGDDGTAEHNDNRTEAVDDTNDLRLDKAVDLHVISSEEGAVPEDKESSNVSTAVLLRQAEVMGDDGIAEHNDNVDVLKIEDLANTGQIVKRTEAVDDTNDLRLDIAVDLHVTSSEEEAVPEDKESSNVSTAVLLRQAEVMGDDGIAEHNYNIHKEGDNLESEIIASRKRSLVETEAGATSKRQKLSRPPRYFDPPDLPAFKPCKIIYGNRKTKRSKKKKVCYICARLGHNGKSCPQANNCSMCSKKENENNAEEDNTTILCLKCGSSGHDMFSCRNDYDPEDLKNIQCYICKDFGHLCCTRNTIEGSSQASCYNCGESDHYGFECTKLNEIVNGHQSESLCSKCKKRIQWQRNWILDTKATLAETSVERDAAAVKPVKAKSRKAKSRKSRRRERKKPPMPTTIATQSQPNMSMTGCRMPTFGPNTYMRGYRVPTFGPNMSMGGYRMPTFGPNMPMGGYRMPTFGQHYREPGSNVWLSPAAAAARNSFNNPAALNQSSYQHIRPSSNYQTGGLPHQNFFNPGTVLPHASYSQQPNHQTRAHLSHHIISHQVGIQVPPNSFDPWAPPPPKIFNQGTQIPRQLQYEVQFPYHNISHQVGTQVPQSTHHGSQAQIQPVHQILSHQMGDHVSQ